MNNLFKFMVSGRSYIRYQFKGVILMKKLDLNGMN